MVFTVVLDPNSWIWGDNAGSALGADLLAPKSVFRGVYLDGSSVGVCLVFGDTIEFWSRSPCHMVCDKYYSAGT